MITIDTKIYKVFIWLLVLSMSIQLRGQTFLKAQISNITKDNIAEVQPQLDSLLATALDLKEHHKALELSQAITDRLIAVQANDSLILRYGTLVLEHYEQLQLLDDSYQKTLFEIANRYYRIKDYKAALQHYYKLLKLQAGAEANVYYHIGKSYYRMGDFFRAESFYNKAITIYTKAANHSELVEVYFALVRVYNKLRVDKGQEKQLEALVKLQDLAQKVPFTAWQNLLLNNYMANYYNTPGTYDFEVSKRYYLKNLALAKSVNNTEFLCATCNNLGDLYNEARNDSALVYLNKSLKYCRENTFYYTYSQISYAHMNAGQLDTALVYINKAIKRLLPKKTSLSSQTIEEIQNVSDRINLMLALDRKAEILIKTYHSTNALKEIREALKDLELIDAIIDAIAIDATDERSQLHWRKEASNVYAKAIYCARILEQPNAAFYFYEKNRALLLTQSILASKADIPKSLKTKEQQLKTQIGALESQWYESPESNVLKDSLVQTRLEYQAFKDALKAQFPKSYDIKNKTKLFELSAIQQQLSSHVVVVSFSELPASITNTITGMAFTKDNTLLFDIEMTPEFSEALKHFKLRMRTPFTTHANKATFLEAANRVYRTLFPKALESMIGTKELILLPAGTLEGVPFEALIKDLKNERYVIEEHAVSYAYSMSFMSHNKQLERDIDPNLVGFGPMEFLDTTLSDLPSSAAELNEIHQLTGGTIYKKELATKAQFFEAAPTASILHLATHAELSKSPQIAFYDHPLNLYELYGLNTRAELVVLSACETAQGEMAKGEGVMSLSRGFFYSGANTVLSTLWKINDKASAKIMTRFYKYLEEGYTKSKALQLAKIDYLKQHELGEKAPYFWASYVLAGDPSTVHMPRPRSYGRWLVLVLVIIVLMVVLKKKKIY